MNIIPRVMAIHDISGYGRVSLTEVLPVMSAMGIEVCPLPTAVLSTHTYEFTDYTFCDLTDEIPAILKHWQKLELEFDAVYSGYVGSAKQLEIIEDIMTGAKKDGSLIVVDPVMGDNVLVQGTYSDRMKELVCGMKRLCRIADVITPNVTEACLLLGEDYPTGPLNNATIKRYLKGLSELGAEKIFITSVMDSENSMCVAVYDRAIDKYFKVNCGFVNRPFHGTGDIYTSVLTGAMLKNMSTIESANYAAGFVHAAILETIKHEQMKIRDGVIFEPVLAKYFSSDETEKRYVEI